MFDRSPDANLNASTPLMAGYTLNVANHPWTILFTGTPHRESSSPIWLVPSVLAGGFMLSLALFAVTLWQYRRLRPVGAEPRRLRHHRTLREAAEHRSLGPDAGLLGDRFEPTAEAAVGLGERGRLRVSDPLNHVPVVAGVTRRRQRRPRREPREPAVGVEDVEQTEQVVLVDATSVHQDQGALRVAGRRPESVDEVVEGHCGVTVSPT